MKAPLRKFRPSLALLCLVVLSLDDWPRNAMAADAGDSALVEVTAGAGVRSMTLPHFEPQLPVAPGRREFMVVCVTCHSSRYVTMQPPFPRRQWEETVAKMIKSYGAPADEKQASAIVDYLVAIDGTSPSGAPAPAVDDDEAAAIAGPHFQADPEPTPALALASDAGGHAAEVKRGAALFMQDCGGCHGIAGKGNGVAGQAFLRKPADLTAAQFNVKLLGQVLWNGVPGTSMPSWRSLPQNDLAALAGYVQTLHPVASQEAAAPEDLARGKTLFGQDCAICHGVNGDGKSAIAATLAPTPANLNWIQPDFDYILQILRDGIAGTSMPSWKEQLSEPDRRAVAGFVRSLYEPAKVMKGNE